MHKLNWMKTEWDRLDSLAWYKGLQRRGAHKMSSSSDKEEDDVGASERSPVIDHSDGEKRGEADSTEELAAKDVAGPQHSKNIDIEKE